MNRESFLRNLISEQWTLKEFAEYIQMPYSTLLSILKNVGGASVNNAKKICDGLGLSLDALDSPDTGDVLVNFHVPRGLTQKEHELFQRALSSFVAGEREKDD